jgi:hypothetical protein
MERAARARLAALTGALGELLQDLDRKLQSEAMARYDTKRREPKRNTESGSRFEVQHSKGGLSEVLRDMRDLLQQESRARTDIASATASLERVLQSSGLGSAPHTPTA